MNDILGTNELTGDNLGIIVFDKIRKNPTAMDAIKK